MARRMKRASAGDAPSRGPYSAARREFEEEIGLPAPEGDPIDLGKVRQAGGKIVACVGAPSAVRTEGSQIGWMHRSSRISVELEWPRGSGTERDRSRSGQAAWMTPETARQKLIPAQVAFVDRLLDRLGI